MIYLSIDVGLKNLGYIIYDSDSDKILRWGIINICNDNANTVNLIDVGKNICDMFIKQVDIFDIGKVIIENQQGINAIRMKSVQMMITMYFIKNNIDVCHWSSSNKLKKYNLPKKTTYVQRKKESIRITKEEIINQYPEWETHFSKHPKKDDLADAFLQLISYLECDKI